MGRPELALDRDAGPLAALAVDLRELRQKHGNPGYRELARRAGFSASVLSSATSGVRLPTLRVTLAFVEACGGDPAAWERRWQETVWLVGTPAEAAARSAADPPPRPGASRVDQLPGGYRSLVGRRPELARLDASIEPRPGAPAPVLVTGPLGVGKSALAVRWAHDNRARFPDGVLYADLAAEGAGQREVLAGFLYALGQRGELPTATTSAAALFRSLIAKRRMLVLLDNATDEAQLRPLLVEAPGVHIVITSRARLAGLDGVERVVLDPLPTEQSVALLAEIVGRSQVTAQRRAAAEIGRLCGHLPIALRVVGAGIAVRSGWTLARAAARLREESHRLDHLRAGDIDLRERLALACDRLDPRERMAFGCLGVLPAPEVSAAQVAKRLETPPHVAEELLERLVDTGLLQSTPDAGAYRMPVLFRLYAGELAGDPAGEPGNLIELPRLPRPRRATVRSAEVHGE